MNYAQTIEYLYNAAPAFTKVGAGAYKEGLANTMALDQHFHHPHQNFLTIHVGGTNGKGSCSHTLAAVLQAAGYKVGLYTSPHLVDFRERIRVNGVPVPEEYVVDFVRVERRFFEPLQPSFFELVTAMAFKYFADSRVDVAVIEVGLGGRLDCTNIISPLLSLITNISLDHTQFLGNTLAAIAAEKAGIIKPGVPCVVGETTDETRPVFVQRAAELASPLAFAEEMEVDCNARFQLTGHYQAKNKRTILAAIETLRRQHAIDPLRQPLEISDEAVREGFEHVVELTGLMGRWQKLQDRPLVVCDAGHNIGGWQYLHQQIAQTYAALAANCQASGAGSPVLRIVFGMVDDKDVDAVMQLLPKNAAYYFCQATTHRAIGSQALQVLAQSHGLEGRAFDTVAAAYHQALSEASSHDFIFVGGSCYVLADLFTALNN